MRLSDGDHMDKKHAGGEERRGEELVSWKRIQGSGTPPCESLEPSLPAERAAGSGGLILLERCKEVARDLYLQKRSCLSTPLRPTPFGKRLISIMMMF